MRPNAEIEDGTERAVNLRTRLQTSPESPHAASLHLQGRHLRHRPDLPGPVLHPGDAREEDVQHAPEEGEGEEANLHLEVPRLVELAEDEVSEVGGGPLASDGAHDADPDEDQIQAQSLLLQNNLAPGQLEA